MVTYRNNVQHQELNPDMVAHLSINRARRRLTSLIEASALTTTPDHQLGSAFHVCPTVEGCCVLCVYSVASHLPLLFHIVTLLVCTGPLSLQASTHGLVINIIHSLCTCSQLAFSGQSAVAFELQVAEDVWHNSRGVGRSKVSIHCLFL